MSHNTNEELNSVVLTRAEAIEELLNQYDNCPPDEILSMFKGVMREQFEEECNDGLLDNLDCMNDEINWIIKDKKE